MITKTKIFFLLTLLFFGCKTDSFDFDKLSNQTGLSPEIKFPVAQAEIGLERFLDKLNFEVDDTKDAYGTIYLKDTISDIGSLKIVEVFDVGEISNAFSTSYTLNPIPLDDLSFYNDSFSFGQISSFADGSTSPAIPPIPTTTVSLGTTTILTNNFSVVGLKSGTLNMAFTNNFPIPLTLQFHIENSTGVRLISSGIKTISVAESANIAVDLTSANLEKDVTILLELSSPGINSTVTMEYATQTLNINASYSDVMVADFVVDAPTPFSFDFDQLVDFSTPNNEILTQLNLEKAKLNLTILNELEIQAELEFKNPTAFVSQNPFTKTYQLTETTNPQSFDWEINDLELNFDQKDSISTFMLKYLVNFIIPPGKTIESGKRIEIAGSFSSLELLSAFGDFGVKSSSFTDKLFIEENLTDYIDKIKWFDPKINLVVHSTLGVPVSYNLNVKGYRKDGSFVILNTDQEEFLISAPSTILDQATTRITYDNTNSNVEEVVTFLPDDFLETTINFNTNTNQNDLTSNFVHKDSKIWFDAEVEAPAHFNITDLSINDTIRFSPILGDDDTDVNRIQQATLFMNFTSDLPLNIKIKTELIDTLSNAILANFEPVELIAAPTNDIGEVTSPSKFSTTLEFSNSDVQAFKKGNGLAINVLVDSEENQTKNVKISSSTKIKLSLAAKVKINLNE